MASSESDLRSDSELAPFRRLLGFRGPRRSFEAMLEILFTDWLLLFSLFFLTPRFFRFCWSDDSKQREKSAG
jgi:hypothetical protein